MFFNFWKLFPISYNLVPRAFSLAWARPQGREKALETRLHFIKKIPKTYCIVTLTFNTYFVLTTFLLTLKLLSYHCYVLVKMISLFWKHLFLSSLILVSLIFYKLKSKKVTWLNASSPGEHALLSDKDYNNKT